MDAQIQVVGGTSGELAALGEWLRGEGELRSRVRTVRRPISSTELGSVPELLSVALGAGGAGTVLVSSLKTWLATRRTAVKVTVKVGDRSVTMDIQTVGEVAPILEQILKAADEI